MPQDTIMFFDDYKQDLVRSDLIESHETYDDYLLKQAEIHMGIEAFPVKPVVNSQQMFAFVDNGRWMVTCNACNAGIVVDMDRDTEIVSPTICPCCSYQGWVGVVVPQNYQEIENELLKQPGFRNKTAFRNWEPGWDMDYLRFRTQRAIDQVASGMPNPRGASIGATRLWSVGEVLTASNKNTFERQVLRDLAGRNGPIGPYENPIILHKGTTTQRDAITAEAGMVMYNETESRMEVYDSSWGPPFKYHISQNFGNTNTDNNLGDVVTVNHDLGRAPVLFQLRFVALEDNNRFSTGDIVYSIQAEGTDTDRWEFYCQVQSATASSYDIYFKPGEIRIGEKGNEGEFSTYIVPSVDGNNRFAAQMVAFA